MKGLYVIVDLPSLRERELEPRSFAQAVLETRVAALQLRAKNVPDEEIVALLEFLRPITRERGVPLICNDRPDLADRAACDAVHVGQTDMKCDEVRRKFPRLKIGLSTHNIEELAQAMRMKPDYVAYGPVFPTLSKPDADVEVGIKGLVAARRWVGGTPLVAIGGIALANAADVARYADAGAVIAGLLVGPSYREITQRVRLMHQLLGGTV